MRKTNKTWFVRWIGVLMCAVMLGGALVVNGAAASAATVSATVSPDITVKVDGQTQTFFTVSGTQVHPILYNGTTYLPVRAIGVLMNKNVNWDQSTLTVTLSGTRTTSAAAGSWTRIPRSGSFRRSCAPTLPLWWTARPAPSLMPMEPRSTRCSTAAPPICR